MGCCLGAVLALLAPRVVLAVLFFFTSWLSRAYDSILILIAGFLFLPITTLVYAWIVNTGASVDGIYLIAIIVAVVLDVGSFGGGHYSRER